MFGRIILFGYPFSYQLLVVSEKRYLKVSKGAPLIMPLASRCAAIEALKYARVFLDRDTNADVLNGNGQAAVRQRFEVDGNLSSAQCVMQSIRDKVADRQLDKTWIGDCDAAPLDGN